MPSHHRRRKSTRTRGIETEDTPTTRAPPDPPLPHYRNHQQQKQQGWTAQRLVRANYQDLGQPDVVENRFMGHLLNIESCRSALWVLLTATSSTTRDFSMEIDAFDLLEADPVLGHLLLRFPSTILQILENAIVAAQKELHREEQHYLQQTNTDDQNGIGNPPPKPPIQLSVKGEKTTEGWRGNKGRTTSSPATRVHARLINLPPTCCRNSVASMEAKDVNTFVQLSGTVVRTSPVQMYESARTYKCTGKHGCSRIFSQYADLEQRTNSLAKPDRCPLMEGGQRCKGTSLQLQKDGSVQTDYQEIKIQEAASRIGIGHIPRSLLIKLQHDLVDKCQPGDEVVVVGTLIAQWQDNGCKPGIECNVGMALEAHSIRVIQENGSSAWTGGTATVADSTSTSTSNPRMVDENEKYLKEFDNYWTQTRRQDYPIASRDFICKAVCPKLYGLHIVKLALLITLIGGYGHNNNNNSNDDSSSDDNGNGLNNSMNLQQQEQEESNGPEPFYIDANHESSSRQQTGAFYGEQQRTTQQQQRQKRKQHQSEVVQTRRRDMSHLLLIGDPGTGKSQILRFAAALCPRSVLTTGIGTTSAGLTCAAVRESNDKEFALEAGALVLADKGVCCIDEFGCIRKEDRTTIHEAMEQQTLSVAKAGIVCKLNCRATVIAVMNPKDCIYDNHASLSANTGLGTPLLSRFDLIFKLVDSPNSDRDSNVTTYLLDRAILGAGYECSGSSNRSMMGGNNNNGNNNLDNTPWSMDKLRAYISIVRDRFHPVLSDEAATLLERHYEKVRSAPSFVIPVTVRFLESLIRLTQAHARLMYRDLCTLEDAVAVLRVMECSAYAYGGFDGGSVSPGELDDVLYSDPMTMDESDFLPDEDFIVFEYRMLKRYNMLDYMPDKKRTQAQELLEGNDNASSSRLTSTQADGWDIFENPRDARQTTTTTVIQDHYGRSYFAPPPTTPSSAHKRRRM